ncbi:cysteine-rich CWC family protein [Moritella sp. 5]|nr:cysteine-rich CWC family protein [Moritella sp. 5]
MNNLEIESMTKSVVDEAVVNIEENVDPMPVPVAKQCSECQAEFGCGVVSAIEQGGCWCQDLPAIMPLGTLSDCLCKACLAKAIGVEIIKQLNAAGSPKARLALAEPYRHQTELVENIDFTIEDGRYVFSEWYHLKRARCCGNGCRHCAYR